MAITCLNDCVFDISIEEIPVMEPHIWVAPNGFSIVGLPTTQHPNGQNIILPVEPWPPNPGWPGQPPHEHEEGMAPISQRRAAPTPPPAAAPHREPKR